MVKKAITLLRRRISTEPLSFNLLPDLFTLTQLQHVYEAILKDDIDKRNFRKRIKSIDFIEKTELIDKTTSKRGAALYRFNKKAYPRTRRLKNRNMLEELKEKVFRANLDLVKHELVIFMG